MYILNFGSVKLITASSGNISLEANDLWLETDEAVFGTFEGVPIGIRRQPVTGENLKKAFVRLF